jgi:hypothetical protein
MGRMATLRGWTEKCRSSRRPSAVRLLCAPASVRDERFHVMIPIRKRGFDCPKALLDLLLLAVEHLVKLGVTLGVRNRLV